MALVKCSECSREISNKAASCPHCGCPIEQVINVRCPGCGKMKHLLTCEWVKCAMCGKVFVPSKTQSVEVNINPSTDLTFVKTEIVQSLVTERDETKQGQDGIKLQTPGNESKSSPKSPFIPDRIQGLLGLVALLVLFWFVHVLTKRGGDGVPTANKSTVKLSAEKPVMERDYARLDADGGKIFVAVSEDAFNEMDAFAGKKDLSSIFTLSTVGKVLYLPSGTKVMVLSKGYHQSKVSVSSGDSAGQTVYVHTALLKPLQ